jgi:hypothetical protein
MPNWCSNYIVFAGTKENIEALNNAIKTAIELEDKEKKAQKIHSSDIVDGYFYNIYVDDVLTYDDNDEIVMQYETRWSPNIKDVSILCKEFNVTADHDYSELGNLVEGSTQYFENGTYVDNPVHEEFLKSIDYCYGDDDCYMFLPNGNTYNTLCELIDEEYQNWKEKNT